MTSEPEVVKCIYCNTDVAEEEGGVPEVATGLLSGSQPSTTQAVASFANGMGALASTSRLASLARRDNIFLILAAMIAMDYFEIITRVQSLAPVC